MNIEEVLKENGMTLGEIETSETGIYCLNEERKIVYWNPAAEKLTGYSSDVMVGLNCFNSGLRHQDEQGRPMCVSMCPIMATIFDGKGRSQKVSAACDDGERRWMNVSTKALVKNGTICGAMEFFEPAE